MTKPPKPKPVDHRTERVGTDYHYRLISVGGADASILDAVAGVGWASP